MADEQTQSPATSGDAKGAAQAATGAATGTDEKGIVDRAKDAVSGAAQNVGDAISSGMNYIKETVAGDSQQAAASVYEIGDPYGFTELVDPEGRARNLIYSRLSSVDIYPCYYAQSYLYNEDKKKSIFKYGIGYQNAMDHFSKMIKNYTSEGANYNSVRIYLTEDSSTSVGITNTYEDNFFQKAADALSSALSSFTKITSSISSHAMNKGVEEIIGSLNTDNIVEGATSGLNVGEGTKDLLGSAVDGLKQSASIILKGNKISLPKVWRSSDFSSSFTITTTLYSAYGNPRHMANRIVGPVLILLLLAAPQSDDMISYGKPFACTVHYPGHSEIKLACIKSLSIQRGGGDKGKNQYGQPLSVNLSIEFGSLVDGFMAFASHNDEVKIPAYEKGAFARVHAGGMYSLDRTNNLNSSVFPTLTPTVGDIIQSFYGGSKHVNFDRSTYKNGGSRQVGQIGGSNSSDGGDLFGDLFGDAGLDGVYGNIMDSVSDQFSGMTNILGGAMDAIRGVSGVVSEMTSKANGLVNSIAGSGGILNIATGGAFSKTALGQAVSRFQSKANSQVTQFRQTSNAAQKVIGAAGNISKLLGGFF